MTYRYLIWLVVLFNIVFFRQNCLSQENGSLDIIANHSQISTLDAMSRKRMADKVEMICLYSVLDGKVQTVVLEKADIKRKTPFNVNGYVSGITVFCDDEMVVGVDGQEMSKIRKNADGTFSLKYFGKLAPQELILSNLGKDYEEKLLSENGTAKDDDAFLDGIYSFFPKVAGDSVSQNNVFSITLNDGGDKLDIAVKQNGYRDISALHPHQETQKNEITFRYLGTRFEKLEKECSDFGDRLKAIAEGIGSVESTFKMDLVNKVNIIDYEDIQNAVTCIEGDDIWIYADMFRKESLDELKSIAEHESLHKLVRKKAFTINSDVRDLYADLKGYDVLSYERFMIVTTGVGLPENAEEREKKNSFFAFINERNFLEGMKGGHSDDNLDEFCTSFIHSLMFVNRLKPNLENNVVAPGKGKPGQPLSLQQQITLLKHYLGLTEIMLKAVNEESAPGKASSDQTEVFLMRCLREIENVQARQTLVTRDS